MKHIAKHAKPYTFLILISIVMIAVQAYANLLLPDLMSDMVNIGIQDYSNKILLENSNETINILKDEQIAFIYKTGFLMLLAAIASGSITMAVRCLTSYVGYGISKDIRKSIFEKIESFNGQEIDNFSTASLITRATNDVQQMQALFSMGIRVMFFAPFMAIGGIIMAINKAPSLIWVNALSVILVIMLIVSMQSLILPKFKKIQILTDKLNLVAREALSGIMVVRAFSNQKYEEERFDETNTEYRKTNLFINRMMSLMSPTMTFIQAGVPILIVWVAAPVIAQSNLLVGDMLAFIQYSGNIMQAFMMMTSMFNIIPRSAVSINRINEVLSEENTITEVKNSKTIADKNCSIEFKNVNFKYPKSENSALSDINLSIPKGSTTAIIGSTGCGKTTILNLLLRFYDATSGDILINGTNIKELSLENLRELIGYAPQKSILFSGSLKTNITKAKENASDEEINKVLSIAQMESFVLTKEEGLDFHIAQGGTNVSGGQRQRIAIARALIKSSPILAFDDSFSALDFKTDTNLRKAIYENYKNPTIIIISQRVSSIMKADQIVVMDKGRIVACGKHEDLIQSSLEYQEIANSQLTSEEV